MHVAMIYTLCEMTVEHIRIRLAAHDERYTKAIQIRIGDEYSLHQFDVDDQFLIDNFLVNLESTNLWGGEETLLALSEIFQCSITVYREGSFNVCIDANATAVNSIRIVYRGLLNAWNHYDSFLQFESISCSTQLLIQCCLCSF